MNPLMSAFALLSGLLVGMSGAGGGSIVTPVLILVFGLNPVAAVSSDLAASLVINPFGAMLHTARRRVDRPLLRWLWLGSIPAAFLGALLLSFIPGQDLVNHIIRFLVGTALGLTAFTLLARITTKTSRPPADPTDEPARGSVLDTASAVRPLAVAALGAFAGILVGLTSIGAGSIIAAGLLILFPRIPITRLVGTDVVHTIPMVASATLGHLLFGQVHFAVAFSLIAGGVPGVLLGAYLAGRVPATALRSVLGVLLTGISLSLLRAPVPVVLGGIAITAATLAAVMTARRRRVPASSAQIVAPVRKRVP